MWNLGSRVTTTRGAMYRPFYKYLEILLSFTNLSELSIAKLVY